MKLLLVALSLLMLAGCSNGLSIDRSHPSANHDNRVQFVVLHYTSADEARSLQLLTHGEVSSHYLIGDRSATVYQLVDESQRAWHAGDSQWDGRTWLNSSRGHQCIATGWRLARAFGPINVKSIVTCC